MSDVLDAALSIFDCDRAWLMHPCDPEPSLTRSRCSGRVLSSPVSLAWATRYRPTRRRPICFVRCGCQSGPVQFGPHSVQHPLSSELAQRRRVQSRIVMALYPKGELPYIFGASQCSYARLWTPREEFCSRR